MDARSQFTVRNGVKYSRIPQHVRGHNTIMPSGYHPGIPHSDQAYTKWDADRDEVEVDFKRLEPGQKSAWFSGPKGTVLKVLLILVMFLLGLILGYVIRRSVNSPVRIQCPYYTEGYERYSTDISQELQAHISLDNIKNNLRNYTTHVHLAGIRNNNILCDVIKQQLTDLGLRVSVAKYRVLLSYADWQRPNKVSLLMDNETVKFETHYHGPPHDNHPELTTPYLAFSPNDSVTAELMYANYGEQSDFDHLDSCNNKIVIMRYGKIYRGTKVENAHKCGAVGVLLYPDPADVTYHMRSEADVYPHTWYLPGWAAKRGTILKDLTGDPLTHGLPAIGGVHRIAISEADLPKIPAHSIGYDDAEQIMMHLDGKLIQDFMGGMHDNVTYRTGPGYQGVRQNWTVKLEVHNEMEMRDISNVIAVIKGHEEPDRYVIVGVHYDAWTFGASDSNTGTAILMELAKCFTEMTKKGWKPRRTIMFIHWDGEEQGIMGSYEWVEEHRKKLQERTVAYINLDRPVAGSYTLHVESSPEMKNLIFNITHMLPATGQLHETLYEQWKQRSPDDTGNGPRIDSVSGGSDQAPFIFMLGVPVIWPQYIHDIRITRVYPGYHTDIDNFEYQTQLIDPGFEAVDIYTKLASELVLQLSSLTRLPFDVRGLASAVSDSFNTLKSYLTQATAEDNQLLEPLHTAIADFTETAARFHDSFQQIDLSDPLEMRRYNDRAMKLSQSFIYPEGLPNRPQYKNVLFAPSAHDTYSRSTFTGIRDAFVNYQAAADAKRSDTDKLMDVVKKQISIATLAVQSASSFLSDESFP